jgi:ABC-type nitrate/sulfonate/bicarbonate transport system substrate-binding protein
MKNNTIVIAVAITVALGIGAGLVYATKKTEPKKLVTIRVLESSAPNQWEIAQKLTGRDILGEQGVTLERISGVQSTGGTQTLQALLADNIDYGSSHWPAWINIIAAGGKIKAVVTGGVTTKETVSNGFVVLENSDIHSAKDLIGKRIAVNVLGAENDYVVRQYLKQNGLSIDQVQLIVVPWAQQELMLKSGQVDVSASFSYGYFGLASERGGLRELPGTRNYDIKGNNVASGSGFREDFIQKHPETVRSFITALEKTQRLVREEFVKDPERVRKVYADIAAEKGGNPKLAAYYRPGWSPDYPFATDKDIQYWFDVIETEGKLKPGQLKPSDIYTHEYNSFFKK